MEILTSHNFKKMHEQSDKTCKDANQQFLDALLAEDAEYYEMLFAEPEKFNLFRDWWQRQQATQ